MRGLGVVLLLATGSCAVSSGAPSPFETPQQDARAQDGPGVDGSDASPLVGVLLGAFGHVGADAISTFQRVAHKKVAIGHMRMITWTDPLRSWLPAELAMADANGWVPMITILPVASGQPLSTFDPAYSLSAFASGGNDAQAHVWAEVLRNYRRAVLVRFAPEFNNDAYAWDIRRNGQTAEAYVRAWRHLHDLFAGAGATNVRWVWCPNANWDGAHEFGAAYPGDGFVDWLGLDGYNWGGPTQPGRPWESFPHIFGDSYSEITALSARPIIIAEFGCNEAGDDGSKKADWITHTFETDLRRYPQIKALSWFNVAYDNALWPIDSSPRARDAFVQAIADPFYLSDFVQP